MKIVENGLDSWRPDDVRVSGLAYSRGLRKIVTRDDEKQNKHKKFDEEKKVCS
jgi:hypothetical protein